jgi:hypothetical protein
VLTSQARAGTPTHLLPQAQEVLAAVEREERETRQKLTVLETHEEQLGLEIRRAMATAAMGPHTIEGARKRLAELARRIRAMGATSYMEVVSTTPEAVLASAQARTRCSSRSRRSASARATR